MATLAGAVALAEEKQISTKPRHRWVDIAKAISIVLVVLTHTVGTQIYLNSLLVYIRMPFFFFAAGLFCASAVRKDWPTFLRDKIGNFIYLYMLWFSLEFLLNDVFRFVLRDLPIVFPNPVDLFTKPVQTLWFLYGLSIAFVLAKIFSKVNPYVVAAMLFALYTASISHYQLRDQGLIDRVVQLSPFFFMGALAIRFVDRIPPAFNYACALALPAFYLLADAIHETNLALIGPIRFAVTCCGIAGLVLVCRLVEDKNWSFPLRIIGMSTLYIYVTHRIALNYIDFVLRYFDINIGGNVPYLLAKVAFIVVTTLLVGKILNRFAPWLFAAPWTIHPPKALAPIA